ncbi:MAG: hypothetical protein WC231_02270 [Dehalococcoidales bacterium]|jgi:hypothetical protein|nr:hypothetical protein [Dehalococcoidales bacterium]
MHSLNNSRSTIGLRKSTKERLDRNRAPGQCYDGFLCQLVEVWEEVHSNGNGRVCNSYVKKVSS